MRPYKMLYILNIANRVNNFSYSSMMAARELGIEYYIAGNWSYKSDEDRHADEVKYGIHIYQIDFIRAPYHPGNIRAYRQLATIAQKEHFNIIHCNTPIGGVIGRLIGKKYKIPMVIYQAHGFHFFDGAPILNWLIYYPIERLFAHWTDEIITINQEDFVRGKAKMHLRGQGKVVYVPGVGIDTEKFKNTVVDKNVKRAEIGVPKDTFLLLSIGELSQRKNHETVIKALAQIKRKDIYYAIAGIGDKKEQLEQLAAKVGLSDRVKLLGYRTDVSELCAISDAFIFPSFQEGLPISLMEAMASGMPCIVSKIRGNVDLIDEKGGTLFDPHSVNSCRNAIEQLMTSDRAATIVYNKEKIKKFELGTIIEQMKEIYKSI